MGTDKAIRVICVDDHPVVRKGIAVLVASELDMTFVADASDGEEGVAIVLEHRPDVVLMDLRMPSMDGVSATQKILSQLPETRILILTTYDGDADIHRALLAGASGYLSKESLPDNLLTAIRRVHAGERFVPAELAEKVAGRIGKPQLTERETEVLRQLSRGLRNKEIAFSLGISEQTTQVHVKNILQKLKVQDRTEAVTVGLRRGIIHLDS